MPRRIVEDHKSDNWGRLLLVNDPHDFSTKDRWFVEAQLRFDNEVDAQALFDLLNDRLNDRKIIA